jgi:hypothetical protein
MRVHIGGCRSGVLFDQPVRQGRGCRIGLVVAKQFYPIPVESGSVQAVVVSIMSMTAISALTWYRPLVDGRLGQWVHQAKLREHARRV